MTLKTFFEKFELFADAPNFVTKMQELVLELAVQGKLVEQDPRDGSATTLIENVRNERTRLIKEKRLQNQASITPVADFSTDAALPSNWTWTTLAEIAVINPRNNEDDDTAATFIPMPGIPHTYQGLLNGEIRSWGEIKKAFTHFADGDIALAKITPCFQNGKSVVLRNLSNGIGAGTTELHVARPIGGCVVPEYVWIFLKSPAFISEGIPVMTGSAGQKRVPTSYFALKPFPLPPLAEQKRIVTKVDELMALCDRLEAQQRERNTQQSTLARATVARFADAPTPTHLELLFHKSYSVSPADLRKTILNLAVQGKLVPQNLNDEPVEQMLLRILDEQRRLKQTTVSGPSVREPGETLDYNIPESWRWQALEDLLVFGPTNGFSPKVVEYETPVRSLTLSATTSGRFKPEHLKFILNDIPADSDLWLKDGDILVQRGNTLEYVGVSAIYRGEAHRFVYPDLMMKFRVSSETDVGYVHLAMSSEPCRDFLRARASGTSGSMPKINQTTLKSLPLPLPPLAEQRRIVAKVDQLMALVDQLEIQLAASHATATTLMKAIVAELTEVGTR